MKYFISLLILSSFAFSANAQMKCEGILYDKSVVDRSIEGLAELRLKLDLAMAEGTSSIALKALKHDYATKEKQMLLFIDAHQIMTHEQMFDHMFAHIEGHLEKNDRLREETTDRKVEERAVLHARASDGTKEVFRSVEPGRFAVWKDQQKTEFQITKPFQMAETLTTQLIWKRIALRAKEVLPGKFDDLNPQPSLNKSKEYDLHPVTMVSPNMVARWIEAANALAEINDPLIEEIMPGHTAASILRLPTLAEWDFVHRRRGAAKTEYSFGDDMRDADLYGWHMGNSGGQSHPVARKNPLQVGDADFYDMDGNVNQLVSDFAGKPLRPNKLYVDPTGPSSGEAKIYVGGAFRHHVFLFRLDKSGTASAKLDSALYFVGFRLVRSERPQKKKSILDRLRRGPSSVQVKCENILYDKASIDHSIEGLAKLRLQLDLTLADGRSSLALTALKHDYSVKEREMISYLEAHHIMTSAQMFELMSAFDKKIAEKSSETEEVIRRGEERRTMESIKINGAQTVFHPIQPGSFTHTFYRPLGEVKITKPFQMAATTVSRFIWKKVVMRAQTRFPGRFSALDPSPGTPVKNDNFLPVSSVSYNDISLWLEAANELAKEGDPLIEQVMPGNTKDALLRLPTAAEWDFVHSDRGRTKTRYSFGNDESMIHQYAWLEKNSDRQVHPVAEKLPLYVDGNEFYDMDGNVAEVTSTWAPHMPPKVLEDVDPVGPASGNQKITKGGHIGAIPAMTRIDQATGYASPGQRSLWIGFRLVRELPQSGGTK